MAEKLQFELEPEEERASPSSPAPTGDEIFITPGAPLEFDVAPAGAPQFELRQGPAAPATDVFTSVEQTQQLDIFPSWDEVIGEISRGYGVTRDQIKEYFTNAKEEGLQQRLKLREEMEKGFPPEVFGQEGKSLMQREIEVLQQQEQALRDRIEQEIGEPYESLGGALTRSATRVAMYAPVATLLSGAGFGPVASTIIGGTIASQLAFEVDEPRLADLATEFDSPLLNNAMTRALRYDANDPDWQNQLKQAIEETVLGVATVGTFKLGGTAVRATAKKAKTLFNGTTAARRQHEARAAGVRPGGKEHIPRGSASVRFEGEVYTADIHANAAVVAAERTGRPLEEVAQKGEMGFVTSEGRFVNRGEAFEIQRAAGGIKPGSEEAASEGLMSEHVSDVSGLDHYSNTFRRELSDADAEVARAADEILRQGLDPDDAVSRFEAAIQGVQLKYETEEFVSAGTAAGVTETTPIKTRIFSKQDVERKIEVFKKRLEAGRAPPKADPSEVAALRRALDENDAAVAAAQEKSLRSTLSQRRRELREKIIDRSGTIKREILSVGGIEAQRAVRSFTLALGAPESANKAYKAAYNRIFQDVSKQERSELADLIRLRRIREIKSYRPDWEPPTLPDGMKKTSAEHWEQLLQNKRLSLGEAQWDKLSSAADDYFAEIIKPLDMLMGSGVISAEERIALRRWQYSPIRFIEEIDPTIAELEVRGRPISVKSSGIAALSRGDRDLMLNDPQLFLAEVVGRAHGRAFRNRANQGLYNFAEANPDNLTVRLEKPDEGSWTQVSVMFDGKPRKMWLRSDVVPGWQLDPIGVPLWHRILSGSGLVRPLATGAFAPEFAPVNFFYDTWFAMTTAGSGKLFSPLYPVSVAQLARDLRATASDAFLRKGAFDAYIEEGGGMHLLSHQGFRAAERAQVPEVDTAWQAFQQYAGFVNESTELWVRLAIRNRVLRQRKAEKGFLTPDDHLDATFEARNYLDFSQGGSVTKKVDGWVPYTNAAVQGFRGLGRAIKNSPTEMSLRFAQAGGVFASLYFANTVVNQEAWDSVSDEVKANNLIITTPHFRRDRDGNKRYMYFKVPLDHSMRPWKTLIDGMLERSRTGRMPTNETLRILQDGTGILPGVGNLPPTLSALVAMSANFDWWRGEEIWRGDTSLPPTFERNIVGEDPTSVLSRDLAMTVNPLFEALGAQDMRVSPERMDVAARALFPRSVWTDAVGAGYEALTGQIDDSVLERHSRSLQEGLAKDPFVRRFLGETHPFTKDVDSLRRAQEVASGEAFKRREEVLRQIDTFKLQGEFGERQINTIGKWISEQDPIYRPGLQSYLKEIVKLETTFQRFDPDSIPLTPSRTWWRWLSGARPEARANAFWDQWSLNVLDLESPDKETAELAGQRLRMMRALARNVPGFNPKTSKEFGMELYRLSQETGIALP